MDEQDAAIENTETGIIPVEKPGITQYNTDMSMEDAKKLQTYNIANNMQQMFGLTGNQLSHAQGIANMYQLKHGLTATVPIVCKGATCPYKGVCRIPPQDWAVGGRCIQEIGAMVARFESLCRELAVTDDDAVDMGLVKDVIDVEMMILRADNKLAISGDVLAETIIQVDNKGNEHMGEIIDPVITLKLSLLDRKMKLLEKLNSTRKDKADEMKKKKDPSVKSATLMQKVKLIQQEIRQKTIDGAQQITTTEQVIQSEEEI